MDRRRGAGQPAGASQRSRGRRFAQQAPDVPQQLLGVEANAEVLDAEDPCWSMIEVRKVWSTSPRVGLLGIDPVPSGDVSDLSRCAR